MRVLLDASCLGRSKTGNETYVRGLLSGWANVGKDFPDIELFAAVSDSFPDTEGIHYYPIKKSRFFARNAVQFPQLVRKSCSDLFHATYWCAPWIGSKSVVMVHDVSFVRHPEWFRPGEALFYRTFIKQAVKRASLILTVSDFSKNEIRDIWDLDPSRIQVTPNGPGFSARGSIPPSSMERPYLLFAGGWHPRKNLISLVRAFEKINDEGYEVNLHIAGPRTWLSDQAGRAVKESRWSRRILELGYVSEQRLAEEYSGALMLVYPSLYEGFGLPLLEAFARKCPVCCSSIEAFHEVAGDAALYFDPLDYDSMAGAILNLLKSPVLVKEKVEKGLSRLERFGWDETARETAQAYRKAFSI